MGDVWKTSGRQRLQAQNKTRRSFGAQREQRAALVRADHLYPEAAPSAADDPRMRHHPKRPRRPSEVRGSVGGMYLDPLARRGVAGSRPTAQHGQQQQQPPRGGGRRIRNDASTAHYPVMPPLSREVAVARQPPPVAQTVAVARQPPPVAPSQQPHYAPSSQGRWGPPRGAPGHPYEERRNTFEQNWSTSAARMSHHARHAVPWNPAMPQPHVNRYENEEMRLEENVNRSMPQPMMRMDTMESPHNHPSGYETTFGAPGPAGLFHAQQQQHYQPESPRNHPPVYENTFGPQDPAAADFFHSQQQHYPDPRGAFHYGESPFFSRASPETGNLPPHYAQAPNEGFFQQQHHHPQQQHHQRHTEEIKPPYGGHFDQGMHAQASVLSPPLMQPMEFMETTPPSAYFHSEQSTAVPMRGLNLSRPPEPQHFVDTAMHMAPPVQGFSQFRPPPIQDEPADVAMSDFTTADPGLQEVHGPMPPEQGIPQFRPPVMAPTSEVQHHIFDMASSPSAGPPLQRENTYPPPDGTFTVQPHHPFQMPPSPLPSEPHHPMEIVNQPPDRASPLSQGIRQFQQPRPAQSPVHPVTAQETTTLPPPPPRPVTLVYPTFRGITRPATAPANLLLSSTKTKDKEPMVSKQSQAVDNRVETATPVSESLPPNTESVIQRRPTAVILLGGADNKNDSVEKTTTPMQVDVSENEPPEHAMEPHPRFDLNRAGIRFFRGKVEVDMIGRPLATATESPTTPSPRVRAEGQPSMAESKSPVSSTCSSDDLTIVEPAAKSPKLGHAKGRRESWLSDHESVGSMGSRAGGKSPLSQDLVLLEKPTNVRKSTTAVAGKSSTLGRGIEATMLYLASSSSEEDSVQTVKRSGRTPTSGRGKEADVLSSSSSEEASVQTVKPSGRKPLGSTTDTLKTTAGSSGVGHRRNLFASSSSDDDDSLNSQDLAGATSLWWD